MDHPELQPLTTPVLFLVFNRPGTTRRVFEAIRAQRPGMLFVACDGPRPDKTGEAALVQETRQIATAVDWPCEVKTLFREKNLGCRKAVSAAVTWFFENVEEGIILEDDCLPSPDFFRFCAELLDRFRMEERVMHISGDNFQRGQRYGESSYYFSRYTHIWGWATWRRAWRHYDPDIALWPEVRRDLKRYLGEDGLLCHFWNNIFEQVYRGRIDTWDYQWNIACLARNGLAVLPAENLVGNIGFATGGAHTRKADNRHAAPPAGRLSFPLHHPEGIKRNAAADRFTERHHYKITWGRYFKNQIRSFFHG